MDREKEKESCCFRVEPSTKAYSIVVWFDSQSISFLRFTLLQFHRYGTYYGAPGDLLEVYEGEWHLGKPHEKGTLRLRGGDFFKGMFKFGMVKTLLFSSTLLSLIISSRMERVCGHTQMVLYTKEHGSKDCESGKEVSHFLLLSTWTH